VTKDAFGAVVGSGPSNVAAYYHYSRGDVERGFAEADAVVEREFTTKMVHQGYIEPQTSTASWNADGTITIWTSTQGAFVVRAQVAEVLRRKWSRRFGGRAGVR